jgi:hypothetical protein
LATGREKAKRNFRSLSQHIAFLIEQDDAQRRVSAATDSAGRRATPRKRSKGKEAA